MTARIWEENLFAVLKTIACDFITVHANTKANGFEILGTLPRSMLKYGYRHSGWGYADSKDLEKLIAAATAKLRLLQDRFKIFLLNRRGLQWMREFIDCIDWEEFEE